MRKGALALIFAVCAAATAAAQTVPSDSRFSVGVSGGLGTGHHAGAALGGAFSVRLTPRVDTEFEATYADRGPGVEALIFEGRAQVALLPRNARVVPHVTFGAAAYRAQFDMGGRAMFGQFSQMGGARFTPAQGGMMYGAQGAYRGSMWAGAPNGPMNLSQVPMFYAQRIGNVQMNADGRYASRRFTDPAAVFGGGLTFNATKHLYVMPEARALVVIGDGDTYTVGLVGVRMGVRF